MGQGVGLIAHIMSAQLFASLLTAHKWGLGIGVHMYTCIQPGDPD